MSESAANVDPAEQLDLFAPVAEPAEHEPVEAQRVYQLTELPGTEFEHIFVCQIDESAGMRETA